jgi:cytochrome c556
MNWTLPSVRSMSTAGASLLLGVSLALSVDAQTAPPAAQPVAATPAGRQAVEARKALYTLIGRNFRPLGDVLKGTVKYEDADVEKRIARIAFLAGLVNEEFPDSSNLGDQETKAKPDIWSNRTDFDKKLRDLQVHVVALADVNATDKGPSDAFKAAVTTLGQDCKGCHDNYKIK